MVRSRRQGGADKFSFGYTEYGMPRRLLEIHTHLEFRIEDRAEDKTLGRPLWNPVTAPGKSLALHLSPTTPIPKKTGLMPCEIFYLGTKGWEKTGT